MALTYKLLNSGQKRNLVGAALISPWRIRSVCAIRPVVDSTGKGESLEFLVVSADH